MKTIFTIVFGILLLALQNYLSQRKSWLWGGILPLVIISFAVWVIYTKNLALNFKTVFPYILLLLIFIEEWMEGRKRLKKQKSK